MAVQSASWHNDPVPDDALIPRAEEDRPILPWKLVAGAFLHFVVPIYLVAVIVDTLLAMPKEAGAEAMLRHALPFSGRFLVVYALLALAVSLGAAAVDPLLRARRRRRTRHGPQAGAWLSARHVARSVADGRGRFGARADAALAMMGATRWDHGDPGYQSLSTDLHTLVRTSADALSAAAPDRQAEIGDRATRALEQLQDALEDLNRAQEQRRDADAQAAARYVELRYGPSDFSGSGE
jgi:ElaB/YqjD/DUF883 family membrane-anchored ribosome-binding protein